MPRARQDLARLELVVRGLVETSPPVAGFFDGADEVTLGRAPGRLDVIGGIADYSGSLVLELPLREAACVAAARTEDAWVRVASLAGARREARFAAPELWRACESFETLRVYIAQQRPDVSWAAYLLGGLVELAGRGAELSGGLRVLLDSAVPEGKGVSSSAAIEVAALSALSELWQVQLTGPELALACQRVENRVVGAPCGVMDQMTSACGQPGRLLKILCQPAELRGFVDPPPGIEFFGVDSGLRHAVVGADYRQVRVAAFMGLRILAERLGAAVRSIGEGRVVLEADPLAGYLANVRPDALTSSLREALPERISGAEFLARFGGISDDVARVDPASNYMVRAATLHPIYEHARVEQFAHALPSATTAAELASLGELMFASHASYSACGLSSDGTDDLVDRVRALGHGAGVFGAKISGGGSGGTVSVLARTSALPQLRAISELYAAKTGRSSQVFSGSSPGAAALPARRLGLTR